MIFLLLLITLIPLISGYLEPSNAFYHINITFYKKSQDFILPQTGFASVYSKRLIVKIRAFSRYFEISAYTHSLIPVTVLHSGGNVSYTHSHFIGKLKDDPESNVHGYVINNIFLGIITTKHETYHIEPSREPNKAIMYRESDIKENYPFGNDFIKNEYNDDLFKDENLDVRETYTAYDTVVWKNKMCPMELAADHTFTRSRNYNYAIISGELAVILQKANDIYEATDFDFDGEADKVGIRISKITIYSDPNMRTYRLGNEELYGTQLLDEYSAMNIQHFCLSVIFIHRYPKEGTHPVGQMYLGNPKFKNGGICTQPAFFFGRITSRNSGYVTTLTFGKPSTRTRIVSTFTHEVAHAFGADHDPFNLTCAPGGEDGHYIMYPLTNDRGKKNTFLFSPCSRKYIWDNLRASSNCFLNKQPGFCGDGIRNAGEECDCGSPINCFNTDPCCNPPGTSNQCKYKPEKQCLPEEGQCCNKYCRFAKRSENINCHVDCYYGSSCDGTSAFCPKKVPLPSGHNCTGCPTSINCKCDGKGACLSPIIPQINKIADDIIASIAAKVKGQQSFNDYLLIIVPVVFFILAAIAVRIAYRKISKSEKIPFEEEMLLGARRKKKKFRNNF